MDDGCLYVIEMAEETSFAIFHHYFMKYENAREYLWNYYLTHNGKDADKDDKEHTRWILEMTGYIENVGLIREEYFEDFEY